MNIFVHFIVIRNIFSFVLLRFPGILLLSVSIRLCHSAQTLIQDSLCPLSFAKWHTKVSNLLSCSHTLSASPKASRAVNNCKSFSNLSSSSNFQTWLSVPSWASVACQTAHSTFQKQWRSEKPPISGSSSDQPKPHPLYDFSQHLGISVLITLSSMNL